LCSLAIGKLIRYAARVVIASERLSLSLDGRVVYKFKRRWKDGTSAIALEPLAIVERLAVLILRPRHPLLTYHGVLAPRRSNLCRNSAPGRVGVLRPQPGAPQTLYVKRLHRVPGRTPSTLAKHLADLVGMRDRELPEPHIESVTVLPVVALDLVERLLETPEVVQDHILALALVHG